MSLEKFRRNRMIILTPKATAYQAARAMADNHIGSVLVSERGRIMGIITDRDLVLTVMAGGLDPKETRLHEIMSEEVVQCDSSSSLEEAVRLMREHGIRRIPLVENHEPVGLLTFDDLVIDNRLKLEDLRSIVEAQLEVESPQKPAGEHHPVARSNAASKTRALMRARDRAESTYNGFLNAVVDASGFSRNAAEQAVLIATCMLCRRLTPGEAEDLIAQLPSKLQSPLANCTTGPDRTVSREAIIDEIGRALGIGTMEAERVMLAVFKVLAEKVAAGQIEEVRGQLPEEMKDLIPLPS